MFFLLFCLYLRATIKFLISSERAISLEDETDKTCDNQNLNKIRATIGDKNFHLLSMYYRTQID